MTSTSWTHRSVALVLSLMLLAVVSTGCNIFDWTHEEGGSSSAETLLQDAQDALLDKNYTDALRYAEKGIAKDPAPMKYPDLRWVASSAVLGKSGVSWTFLMEALSNNTPASKALPGAPRIAEDSQILDLSLEDLLAIAEACPAAVAFLSEILEALENGDITPEDILGFQFDIELGFSIASIMTSFITTLDEDQDLSNGFVQNPAVTIWSGDNGYFFEVETPFPDPPAGEPPYADENDFVKRVLLEPQWDLFCAALIACNQAYGTAILPNPWAPINCSLTGVDPLPGDVDEGYIVGQVLVYVHLGILALFNQYLATP